MELAVVKYIKKYGLVKTVEDFSLKTREYEHVIILKYDQLGSPMSAIEVQESRGLILDKNDWSVQAMAFMKFFNSAEGNAAKINWANARILEKLDGSILNLWFNKYENKWSVSTSGTAFAEGGLSSIPDMTFADLFWKTWGNLNYSLDGLNEDINYIFEMTTPYNIIVTPHSESKITLIGARNIKTLNEFTYKGLMVISIEKNIPLVKEFSFKNKSAQTLINTFKNMPFSEEGYVVLDDKLSSYSHNRVKIKNPAFVSVHHLTTGSIYNIMGVVKTNEVEEFAAAFGERKEEVYELQAKYIELSEDLEKSWDTLSYLKPKDVTKEEKKKFAMNVFRVCETHNTTKFSGLMFALENGSKTNISDYLFNMNNKDIYSILKQR